MDIIGRLKFFLDNAQITNSQFADTCGIPRPNISQLLNGRNKKVSDDLLHKIHRAYPELSMLWLIFGEGEPGDFSNIELSTAENNKKESTAIPYSFDDEPFTPVQYTIDAHNEISATRVNTSSQQETSVENQDSASISGTAKQFTLPQTENPTESRPSSVNISADPTKKITNIVVFYSDNSFQSFLPTKL